MTPAQLSCYAKVWRQKERRENFRAGVITYCMRSIMGEKDAEPMDFFEKRNRSRGLSDLRSKLAAVAKKKGSE
jgi:hypothetical protein